MKYLKYFENNVLYQEIAGPNNNFDSFERIGASDKIIQLLNEYVSDPKFKDFEIEEPFHLVNKPSWDANLEQSVKIVYAYAVFFKEALLRLSGGDARYTDLEISITIYEYTDDWFMVNIVLFDRERDRYRERSRRYIDECNYKCDSVEGIYQLLDLYIH